MATLAYMHYHCHIHYPNPRARVPLERPYQGTDACHTGGISKVQIKALKISYLTLN